MIGNRLWVPDDSTVSGGSGEKMQRKKQEDCLGQSSCLLVTGNFDNGRKLRAARQQFPPGSVGYSEPMRRFRWRR